ncbi:MAG: Asp-tRNA(Asn)/Glu-tRNA(Gln) amidotransferase subunit GatC [Desulfobacteraceae bacterium]|nr:MAG: Asp-tRNA(Asn)/Glu-tRNA(Gln) amidotransferase subunit GatC [Desulfobacteraceae bacterium]
MKITTDDVEKIAHLARLEVDDTRKEKMAEQISRILQYIDTLKEADVEGVNLLSDAAFQTNVMREDETGTPCGPDITLANAPERDEDFYVVPNVVK